MAEQDSTTKRVKFDRQSAIDTPLDELRPLIGVLAAVRFEKQWNAQQEGKRPSLGGFPG